MSEKLKNEDSKVESDLKSAMLESALSENKKLRETVKKIYETQDELRDKIACSVYPHFITNNFDFDLAARDSYRAADVFLRVRILEFSGECFQSFIKKTITDFPNDADLGNFMRNYFNNR